MALRIQSMVMCAIVVTSWHTVAAQEAALFRPERGVRASQSGEVLKLAGSGGWLRTPIIYSDFLWQCDFRLLDARAKAIIGFRAWPGYGDGNPNYEGFRLHLAADATGKRAMGRVSSVGVKFNEVAFESTPVVSTAESWHRVSLRVEGASAVVAIDNRVVSKLEDLSEFAGYLTLAMEDGAAEFKTVHVERLAGPGRPFGDGVSRITYSGIEPPRALVTVKPRYPRGPFDRGIQGSVLLEAVILASGAVGDVRVKRSLESELDEAAIASARQWRFSAATRAGQPVPVVVSLDVSFTIAPRR